MDPLVTPHLFGHLAKFGYTMSYRGRSNICGHKTYMFLSGYYAEFCPCKSMGMGAPPLLLLLLLTGSDTHRDVAFSQVLYVLPVKVFSVI